METRVPAFLQKPVRMLGKGHALKPMPQHRPIVFGVVISRKAGIEFRSLSSQKLDVPCVQRARPGIRV